MRISLAWLNELAPIGTDVDTVARALDALGLAVEEIHHIGGGVPGVVTARVLRTERHPDAAKVHRVYVDAGDGTERHVWCGAFNMQPGDVVPLATLGTEMPDGRRIERRGILGIDSEGMLCSAAELGDGNDHDGIWILPGDTPLGQPYSEALGLRSDVVFELDLTRNRPDCWGHLGVARDLAAHLGVRFDPPRPVLEPTGALRSAPVEIVDGDRCGRFTTTVISHVVVRPSPVDIAQRLLAGGMRPINNVVDASNLVMLELNAPNHAYDLDTLGGGGFRIRRARDGETIVTLDEVERTLAARDLVICDALDVPVGIGGIMGGRDSEISDATTVIALEVAWFEPTGIGQSAAHLGLRSEASARFERGVDPQGCLSAAARFVEVLRLTCPDLVVHDGVVDVVAESCPPGRRSTMVRLDRVRRVLGLEFSVDAIASLIEPIGFEVSSGSEAADVIEVSLPSWRPDCDIDVDVIEEIARHHGYDRIGRIVPTSTVHGALSPLQRRRRQLRQVLLGAGITEAMPSPFLAPGDLERAGMDQPAIPIANPLVAEASLMRPSLRPGLLQAVAYNASHRRDDAALFEIGHVYPPGGLPLPDEREMLAVVLAGRDASAAVALWREIAAALGVGARLEQSRVPEGLHPTRSASLTNGPKVLGVLGEIHPRVLEDFDLSMRVAVLELDLTEILGRPEPVPVARAVSRFPSSDLDLAFVVAEEVPAEKVDKALRQGAGALLAELGLFDVYRGSGIDAGHRSLAYRLRLQAADRTLTDAEIAKARDACVAAVAGVGGRLRS
jgi:phenylalanyl-tRNA synthetase beta chain